jgi:hypothetical protein
VYPDCSGGGPKINSISGFPDIHFVDEEFEVTCDATSSNVTTYNWTVPQNMEVVSGDNTSNIRLKAEIPGTYQGAGLSCTVTDACGTTSKAATSDLLACDISEIKTMTSSTSGFVYRYICYPNNIGCWMIDNSREGNPNVCQYPGHNPGERGCYYSYDEAFGSTSPCPAGWTIPTRQAWEDLYSYWTNNNCEKCGWFTMSRYGQAGVFYGPNGTTPDSWGDGNVQVWVPYPSGSKILLHSNGQHPNNYIVFNDELVPVRCYQPN